jgi:hypothetical protein
MALVVIPPLGGVGGDGGVVGWPLFENCTVDASIFLMIFVVKLPRADGGCLGTRSR